MPKGIRHTPEEIFELLQEADDYEAQGFTKPQTAHKLGISAQTLASWRKQYGGLSEEEIVEIHKLRQENAELKRLLSDKKLESAMLWEIAKGNF